MKRRAEALRLVAELLHHLRAHDPLRVAGVVLDVGGLLEQAAPQEALDDERVQVGPCRVQRRRVTGRPAADDDHVLDVCHGCLSAHALLCIVAPRARSLRHSSTRARKRKNAITPGTSGSQNVNARKTSTATTASPASTRTPRTHRSCHLRRRPRRRGSAAGCRACRRRRPGSAPRAAARRRTRWNAAHSTAIWKAQNSDRAEQRRVLGRGRGSSASCRPAEVAAGTVASFFVIRPSVPVRLAKPSSRRWRSVGTSRIRLVSAHQDHARSPPGGRSS